MNISLDQLLEELDKESSEYLRMAFSEYEDIETILGKCEMVDIDKLLSECETVDIDQLLEECDREFNLFWQAHLRDNAGTDINSQKSDYELFDGMVRRIPVNAED